MRFFTFLENLVGESLPTLVMLVLVISPGGVLGKQQKYPHGVLAVANDLRKTRKKRRFCRFERFLKKDTGVANDFSKVSFLSKSDDRVMSRLQNRLFAFYFQNSVKTGKTAFSRFLRSRRQEHCFCSGFPGFRLKTGKQPLFQHFRLKGRL